eukprot:ANDGO_08526.mRNA.1 Syntaxin-32
MPSVSRLREFDEIHSRLRQSGDPQYQSPFSASALAASSSPGNSTFHKHAAALTSDLNRTTAKLQQLTTLASSKSLFAYPAAQIEELTYIIKQDISVLSARLDDLQTFVKQSVSNSNKQQVEHSEHVVGGIKAALMDATKMFQGVLQQSSSTMKKQEGRRSRFVHTAPLSPSSGIANSSGANAGSPANTGTANTRKTLSSHASPHGHISSSSSSSSSSSHSNIAGSSLLKNQHSSSTGGDDVEEIPRQRQTQMMQVGVTADAQYYESRAEAVQNIESTIVELGAMFQQLASMVAEQQDTVQRIDTDIENTLVNVEAGHNELVKLYNSLSSNRWLILKVFAVLLVFIIFFTVVVA